MVDEDADELVADRLVHERGRDGGVDAARQGAQHAPAADLRADRRHLIGDDVAAVPVGGDARRAVQEVLEDRLAVLRVLDLGVPLHAVQPALVVGECGDRSVLRGGEHLEPLRRKRDRVAVAHPGGLFRRLAVEEGALAVGRSARDAHGGRAVLAAPGLGDLAAEGGGHDLEAVADAEHRHAELEDALVELRCAVVVDARRASGEHDARRVLGGHLGRRHCVRHDLGVDVRLANAAGDQLCVLRAEVDDEDRTGRCGRVGPSEDVRERCVGANLWPPRKSLPRPRGRPDRS